MSTTRQYRPMLTKKPVHSIPVFGNIAFGIALFFTLLFCQNFAFAQVRATGRVFAEIVKPTALSAKASNDHLLKGNETAGETDLMLAEVKLSGGPNINIGVFVQTSFLKAANGETLLFNASACPGYSGDNQNNVAGEKLFTLKGTPGENTRLKKNNIFNGQYRVVFMYN